MTSLEALEGYSGHHSETIDQLLEWPYRRFLKAFNAWQRRKQVEEVETRKNLHISALYANTNLDDDKGTRKDYIESLNKYYEDLKNIVWEPDRVQRENEEMKKMEDNDPFLQAGRRNMQKVLQPKMPGQSSLESLPNG